jgi:lysozyme family protein
MMILTNFDTAFDVIVGIEGRYSNDPNDPGGATCWGVTERVARANGYTGPMETMPVSVAKTIAKEKYWDTHQCSQYDIRIAFLVFDAAYNGGHPAEWLQRAVGVPEDGVIGAGSIGSIRTSDPLKVCLRFQAYHIQYYVGLKDFTYIDGWMNRVASNQIMVSYED